MKELIVAKSAGFCFGVSRSVKMAEEMLAAEQNCYSLGELIHNDDVVRHLQSEGLTVVDGPEQIPPGASVIIRSHGVSRAEFEAVQRTGATVYDATCPKVKRIHEIVAEASAEGRQPVIIGAADHPEVRAICGWCEAPIVVNDAAELAARIADGTIDCAKPLTVVIQTTQTQEKLLECQKIIKKQCTNAKLFDTICGATFTRRQRPRDGPAPAAQWSSSAAATAPTAAISTRSAAVRVQTCNLLKTQRSLIQARSYMRIRSA